MEVKLEKKKRRKIKALLLTAIFLTFVKTFTFPPQSPNFVHISTKSFHQLFGKLCVQCQLNIISCCMHMMINQWKTSETWELFWGSRVSTALEKSAELSVVCALCNSIEQFSSASMSATKKNTQSFVLLNRRWRLRLTTTLSSLARKKNCLRSMFYSSKHNNRVKIIRNWKRMCEDWAFLSIFA